MNNMENKGLKYDDGKLRWDLLPMKEVEKIVEVLTQGATKYGPNMWQAVDNGVERYYAAMLRHLVAWRKGEKHDDDTGCEHLAQVACNAIFLLYLTNLEILRLDLTKIPKGMSVKEYLDNTKKTKSCIQNTVNSEQ